MQIKIAHDVEEALRKNLPVVALESTIISHGMPYPENLETARAVEQVVMDAGATPATIAIINGVVHIGLTQDALTTFAQAKNVKKVSQRDLAFVIAEGLSGGTTVATTMYLAWRAGIRVFATGGIGGVHRGAETSFDISADLKAFAEIPITVISAGAKAILDLPKTLEYLETMGVPVVGFQTDDFPAFYHSRSGLKLSLRADNPQQIASLMHAQDKLKLNQGILVANPIPVDHEMDARIMNQAIQTAIQEAEQQHIKGAALTPFLLGRVKTLTGGDSLKSNIALVKHNAKIAVQIAIAFCQK
ncbi:MAG: pseudouridine-5'-phosphate glycosidase [Bacilli bacterium]